MGNIEFLDENSPEMKKTGLPFSQSSGECVQRAAGFLSVEKARLEKRLSTRRIQIRGRETYEKVMNREEAITNRDAMVKALYSVLFNWLVGRINQTLYRGEDEDKRWIGLLDVFGFEAFESNSFEQVSVLVCLFACLLASTYKTTGNQQQQLNFLSLNFSLHLVLH
jgi:myosin-5